MQNLSAAKAKEMMISVADAIIAAQDMLGDADRAIGDGDHGIGMAKGFEGAKAELEVKDFDDVYQVFFTVGRTMLRLMGGASGAIFSTLFMAGSKNMPPKPEINPKEFSEFFEKALEGIKTRGGAQPGDKTVVDGLVPMVEALKKSAASGDDFPRMIKSAWDGAEAGKEESKKFIAKFGKAKTLGERAVGFPDAGAVSLTVITKAMSDWAAINLA